MALAVPVQGFQVDQHFAGDLGFGRTSVTDTLLLFIDILIGLPIQAPEGELVFEIQRPPPSGGNGFEEW